MNIMIHATPKRMWYVDEFLIPSLIKQGVDKDKIYIWLDDKNYGNLTSWYESCKYVVENYDVREGIWHLQDDVLISSDFVDRANKVSKASVVCGYYSRNDVEYKEMYFGYVPMEKIHFSFQCIYIPNRMMYGFVKWFEKEVMSGNFYPNYYKQNKYDDLFFNLFVKKYHKSEIIYNFEETLVQHVDSLIGGTVVQKENYQWSKTNYSMNFKDEYLVEELSEKLKNRM